MGSVVVIAVIHALIRYIQDQYTTQKTKDLVYAHSEKYRKMLDEVLLRQQQSTSNNSETWEPLHVPSSTTPIHNITTTSTLEPIPLFMENMETDLETYAASITTILPNTISNNNIY